MTETFFASNGIDVHYRTNERGVSVASHHNGYDVTPGHDMDVEQTDALREFFRQEMDTELGRWRSTLDSTWTAKLDTDTGWVQFGNDDGLREFSIVPDSPGTFSPWNAELRAIGAEYVEAHPERKPWEDANPGETWRLTLNDRGTEEHDLTFNVIGVEGFIDARFARAQVSGQQMEYPVDSPAIVAGRRIWPPEDAS